MLPREILYSEDIGLLLSTPLDKRHERDLRAFLSRLDRETLIDVMEPEIAPYVVEEIRTRPNFSELVAVAVSNSLWKFRDVHEYLVVDLIRSLKGGDFGLEDDFIVNELVVLALDRHDKGVGAGALAAEIINFVDNSYSPEVVALVVDALAEFADAPSDPKTLTSTISEAEEWFGEDPDKYQQILWEYASYLRRVLPKEDAELFLQEI